MSIDCHLREIQDLRNAIAEGAPACRETSLALTKLDEARMWLNAARLTELNPWLAATETDDERRRIEQTKPLTATELRDEEIAHKAARYKATRHKVAIYDGAVRRGAHDYAAADEEDTEKAIANALAEFSRNQGKHA